MTYKEMRSWLLDEASQDADGDFDTILKTAINLSYRRLLYETGQEYQDRVFTLTTVASTASYGMPLFVYRILNVEDNTNNISVTETFRDKIDKTYPNYTISDTPRQYFVVGRYGVQTQPSSASTLTVVSSASGDNLNRFVRITGFVSSNSRTEQLTLTGTTTVTSTLTYDANGIERVTLSKNSGFTISGIVTIKAGTTTLSIVPPGVTSPSYLWIQFYPIPSSAVTYDIRCQAHKPALVNDDDWPEVDENFHDLILYGTAADTFGLVGKQDVADRMAVYYDRRLKKFKGLPQEKPNLVRQFQDVPTFTSIPRRPRIANVDY